MKSEAQTVNDYLASLPEDRRAEDRARLQTLNRLTKESFAALDRGEHATFTPESLDTFFDKVDRSTGRR